MQIDTRKVSELQKAQAELEVLKATVVELREELEELNIDFKLEKRISKVLSQHLNLLTKYLLFLVRCGISNGWPLCRMDVILNKLHNGLGDISEDDERSLLGDWESDRQSSDTTTEDRESAQQECIHTDRV